MSLKELADQCTAIFNNGLVEEDDDHQENSEDIDSVVKKSFLV